jgi:predicted peptidase
MMKRRDFCLSLGGAMLVPSLLSEDREVDGFAARIYRSKRGETMPYRLFVPRSYQKRERYPLVLWLHGGAGVGSDNLKQITGGNTSGSHIWTKAENQSRYPSIVVAPQCAENEMWTTLDKATATGQLMLALELIEDLREEFKIDARRIYVAGQSMGGFAAWSLLAIDRPRIFAAAIPVCGGGDESKARLIARVPVWAFHGEKDSSVSVERSRNMIAALKSAGASPRYTEYKDAGHVIWERVFSEPELLPWVFAQRN